MLLPLLTVFALFIPGSSAIPQARRDVKQTLAIAARINATGFTNLVLADQARARFLMAGCHHPHHDNHRRSTSFSVTNAVVGFLLHFYAIT